MKYTYLVFLSLIFIACGDDVADMTVEEYIAVNNLTTMELDEGVHIVINEAGNDVKPHSNSMVEVNYVGELTNGVQFDSGSNVTFQMTNLIQGWKIGLKELGEGGSCKLIVPPGAGYGSNEVGVIPANSVLVFDMELLKVK